MARPIPSLQLQQQPNVFHMGLAAASLPLFSLTAFYSSKLSRWAAYYDSRDLELIIQLNNEMMMENACSGVPSVMLSRDHRRVPLWPKNILMGGKCQLPDFSGILLHDSEGNVDSPPPDNPRPLLTWN